MKADRGGRCTVLGCLLELSKQLPAATVVALLAQALSDALNALVLR
jgi:hypothetical protein